MNAENLHGTWRLLRCYKQVDGEVTDRSPLGEKPYGYIHYLPDSRVSVIIAYDGRKPMGGGRIDSQDAEQAAAYRSMAAYGGTFDVEAEDKVVHHLDISLYENDRGTDYPRTMEFDADGNLTLGTPEVESAEGTVRMFLVWERLPA